MAYEDNDGRFPDDTKVSVRYPLPTDNEQHRNA